MLENSKSTDKAGLDIRIDKSQTLQETFIEIFRYLCLEINEEIANFLENHKILRLLINQELKLEVLDIVYPL